MRVQAYFDGEVDAVSALEIERHLERCAECRELHRHLLQTRTVLRRDLSYFRVPPALAARVRDALADEPVALPAGGERVRPLRLPRVRPFWSGALSGAGLAAIAAALALFLWLPPRTDAVVDDLMSAHLRSLMSTHLIDVVSSDRHTVKPWFAGHTDVSPAVADFDSQGYKLIGGRAEYLAHQRSAVLVYQHGAHLIDVFTWSADGGASRPSKEVTREGYRLLFWRQADLQYCAVSDTGRDELYGLARLIQSIP
jgi:anti-sigma factor RsiW